MIVNNFRPFPIHHLPLFCRLSLSLSFFVSICTFMLVSQSSQRFHVPFALFRHPTHRLSSMSFLPFRESTQCPRRIVLSFALSDHPNPASSQAGPIDIPSSDSRRFQIITNPTYLPATNQTLFSSPLISSFLRIIRL
jgi:hypothetical protein